MKSKLVMTAALAGIFLTACNRNEKSTTETGITDSAGMSSHDMNKMDSHNDMMGMEEMIKKMKAFKMTGDPDYDFAAMMIIHHQGAIDMAQIEVDKGADSSLKSMARQMIMAQQGEIEQFERILGKLAKPVPDSHSHAHAGMESMDKMMNQMMDMKMTGDVDKDFATMMIPHHEGAVTMSEDLIRNGKNPELKKMARQIIADQTKEIRELKNWLKDNPNT